ncbi:hypothetical protein UF75_0680 [Desulfosporosinus sp. I2]|nr:hypothetical protein UF75_0680 [Desulfosporosinus sp. I2]
MLVTAEVLRLVLVSTLTKTPNTVKFAGIPWSTLIKAKH